MISNYCERSFPRNITAKCIKILFIFLFFTNAAFAQDLITESQAAIPPNENLEPNQIFLDIGSIQINFSETTPLRLSTDANSILNSYQSILESGIVLEELNNEFSNIYNESKQNIVLNIPVGNNKYIKLKLEKTNIYTEDFVFKYGSASQSGNTDGSIFYRGVVDKKPLSAAAITITQNSIRGVISDEYGNYVISNLEEHPGKYLLYNEESLSSGIPFNGCGAEDEQLATKILDLESGIKRTQKDAGDCIEIYIECDYSMYEEHNYSVNAVKEYVSALFNEVSLLYYNEQINIFISELYVWTSPDPYRSYNTSSDVLNAFGGYRKDNYNGRLAHLLTRRYMGEGGRAWLDVLCESHYTYQSDRDNDGVLETRNAGPYGVSQVISNTVTPFNTYSWDVFIVSHELGHNFGSPHTHACKWGPDGDEAIDNCWYPEGDCNEGPEPVDGGTIMSYCNSGYAGYLYGINFNNGFGTQPGNLMRSTVANSDCLSECPCGVRSNKDATIFEDYTWLSNYVNQNNCNNDVVTLYSKGSRNYIYIENNQGAILYSQDGTKYCTNRPSLDCLDFYNLYQIEGSWSCNSTNTNVDCGVEGCTDSDACNYNPQAEYNNGSCDYGVVGCQNPCSANTGCTNPAAANYQSNATCDDGSCEFTEGCDADIFSEYPFLNSLVSEANCNNQKITLYKKGIFYYVYVEYANEGVLYYKGNPYCDDPKNNFCINAYSLIEIEKYWSCNNCLENNCNPISCDTNICTNGGTYTWNDTNCSCVLTQSTITGCDDPAATNYNSSVNCPDNSLCNYETTNNDCNDISLFTSYSWLNNIIDTNNCNNVSVSRYDVKTYNYIYIETSNSGFLMYENGELACSDNGDGRCPTLYKISDIDACWSCNGDSPTPVYGCTNINACNYNPNATISNNSCNFGNQSCSFPCAPIPGCLDANACNYNPDACVNNGSCEYESCIDCQNYRGEIFYSPCNGDSYYLIRLTNGTILDPYNAEGVEFDYPDGAIVNFDYNNFSTNSFCSLASKAVLITCIAVAETDNAIFDEFPFLENIVDPLNCTPGSFIEIFQNSSFAYLYYYNGQDGVLYYEDGRRFCSDRTSATCIELYNLSGVTARWDCQQGYTKFAKKPSLLNIEVFPNPNNGIFTFAANGEIDIENALIKIYNTSGQSIQTIENVNLTNNIDLSIYGKGLYWIELLTPTNSLVEKVIVQ